MSDYIVSARKYRPSTFMSVVGQRSLTTTLKNAIKGNHLAHAYLFCGPRGVGKTTCARIFAKTINCQNRTADDEVCNECESCSAFNEQRSYNIHELDAASNNSVEDIRSLIEQVRIPPQIGKYSVYIIDEVHMLSSQAFNAFLKTLEEPPAHAVFILATTEKHKIIPTILSRCQIYDFNRISINDTVEHLQHIALQEGVTAEPEALNVVAQKADGGMRDALSIFDQIVSFSGNHITYKNVIETLNVLDYEYYFKLTDAFLINNVSETMLVFNEILNKGFEAQHFITGLSSHFRDLLMCKDPATVVLLEVGEAIKRRYMEQAQKCPQDFLYKAIEIANECDLNYRLSRNKRLLVELALIRIALLTDEKKKSGIAATSKTIAPIFGQPKAEATPQSTAANAPQPPEKKEAAKASATPKIVLPSISISNPAMNKPQSNAAPTAAPAPSAESAQAKKTAFSQKDLSDNWAAFVGSMNKEVHVIKLIEKALPVLQQDEKFVFNVANSLQEKEILDLKPEILAYLKQGLQNDFIDFSVWIDKSVAQKPKTEQDIFNEMLAANESFKRLADELALEIS